MSDAEALFIYLKPQYMQESHLYIKEETIMKKNKKENIKVREPLKKATRENWNIEERLDDVSGGGRSGVGGGDKKVRLRF